MSYLGLGVALAAPVKISEGGVVGGGVAPGQAVKLGLRLSAGQAGGGDAVTEVGEVEGDRLLPAFASYEKLGFVGCGDSDRPIPAPSCLPGIQIYGAASFGPRDRARLTR